ncbi:BTB/POZ domain-containing protein 6-A, partial [Pseudolycoriella hygida]
MFRSAFDIHRCLSIEHSNTKRTAATLTFEPQNSFTNFPFGTKRLIQPTGSQATCQPKLRPPIIAIGSKLYLKPDKADIFFLFKSNGERVPAHKMILASGSDVFDQMFYGSNGDIKIFDVPPEAFKVFLRSETL